MTTTRKAVLILVLAVLAAACGRAREEEAAESATQEGTGMPGMEGMQGMHGMQGGMMDQMMSHMNMMQGVSADSMKTMLPAHRQMTANMLAQMNKEMRDMNMPATPEWNATADSLRQDLKVMPELSGTELQNLMNGHHRRMMRLMEMHRSMMSNMRM